jgi:hypothetical protein
VLIAIGGEVVKLRKEFGNLKFKSLSAFVLVSLMLFTHCVKKGGSDGSSTANTGNIIGTNRSPSPEPFPTSNDSGVDGEWGGGNNQAGGGLRPKLPGSKGGVLQKGGVGTWVPDDLGKIPPVSNIEYPPKTPDSPKLPETPVTEPIPPPPPGKVWLELKVIQQNYEAWWRNCLTVTVGADSKFVSCNKDANAIGTTVRLAADLPPACNPVQIRIETYKNNAGSCTVGQPCNGPYPSSPSWTRNSNNSSHARYFKVFHRNSEIPNDPLWRAEMSESYSALKSRMESMRNGGKNRMLRAFFEDQPSENLDAAQANSSLAQQKGIDYDDTTFDVSGTDVKFYLDGIGPQGCSDQ